MDAITAEQVALYNDAMEELGGARISSFDDELPSAVTAQQAVMRQLAFALSLYPWTFRSTFVQLSRLSAAPPSAYGHVFDLPRSGQLGAVYEAPDGRAPYLDFRIIDGRLHANAAELWADMETLTGLARLPALFRSALVKGIAADRAILVTGSRTIRADLQAEAYGAPGEYPHGGLLQAAAADDGQQQPGARIDFDGGDMLAARWR